MSGRPRSRSSLCTHHLLGWWCCCWCGFSIGTKHAATSILLLFQKQITLTITNLVFSCAANAIQINQSYGLCVRFSTFRVLKSTTKKTKTKTEMTAMWNINVEQPDQTHILRTRHHFFFYIAYDYFCHS